MWPFRRKVLGLQVRSEPLTPIGLMRQNVLARVPGKITLESPFPLQGPDGRYHCKACGVPFDTYSHEDAIAAIREQLLQWNAGATLLYIQCEKCDRHSVFSPREVITGRSGDPFGPWSNEDLEAADECLTRVFAFSDAERAGIMANTLHHVLNLYQ